MGSWEHESFEFLGYEFRPRRAKNRWGKFFVSFLPGVSPASAKSFRDTVRRWKLHLRSDKSLDDLSRMFGPILAGLDQLLSTLLQVSDVPDLANVQSGADEVGHAQIQETSEAPTPCDALAGSRGRTRSRTVRALA